MGSIVYEKSRTILHGCFFDIGKRDGHDYCVRLSLNGASPFREPLLADKTQNATLLGRYSAACLNWATSVLSASAVVTEFPPFAATDIASNQPAPTSL